MRRLEVRLDWGSQDVRVGTLAEQDGRVYFEYNAAFIAAPLPLSPFKLPVRSGVLAFTDTEFSRVFGVFDDSLPDGWGLLLMDREFRKRGLDPATLSVLDRLAYLGTHGMGALTYHPAESNDDGQALSADLGALAQQAARVLEGSAEELLPAFRIAGGSPAGARPKVLVAVSNDDQMVAGARRTPDGYRQYLVKFPSKNDPADIGPVEAAYAAMAASAGVAMPPTRLFTTSDGERFFASQRFDTTGSERVHMHTLGGLLHANFRIPSVEYDALLKATRLLTKDQRQVEQAFRRMAFNVLAHNRDDHVKNFSFLMDRFGEWRLSPAYDVVFSDGPGGHHSMAVAGESLHPTDAEMLRVAETCDIDAKKARAMLAEVRHAVAAWAKHAREFEVSRASAQRIAKVIGRHSR